MSETRGFYSLWLREIKRFIRDRTRLVTSFVQPLLWLIIFGAAFAARIVLPSTLNYQQVLLPGIIGQTLLFTAMFMGINVIWDKEFGFMKETLVAPVSRLTIFLGKMVGDSTDAFMQGIIVFVIGLAIGIPINPITILYALPVMLLVTFGLVSIGLTIASFMGNLEGFGAIQTFVNLPLFFLSGALFLLKGGGLPSWLTDIAVWNPLTYGVDALRHVILGSAWVPFQVQSLWFDLGAVALFDGIMVVVGTWAFNRMK
ncbi:MAG: ABC transporter permease [Candidatus Bathyarchaeia archaeon]|jgi:ABC-2 type transport system permease protein